MFVEEKEAEKMAATRLTTGTHHILFGGVFMKLTSIRLTS
jgi:hypothetical protein